jgi:acetyltransferase
VLTGDGLAAVFDPRRVALVGASDRVGSVGRLLWDNLADVPGEVLPVCQAATVAGRPAYPDLRDVPGEVDLAVIATPAATVPDIIVAAAAKGVAAVVVLSAGFAETGPAGAKLQAEAVAVARSGGVRLVGPNCFGVQNAERGAARREGVRGRQQGGHHRCGAARLPARGSGHERHLPTA